MVSTTAPPPPSSAAATTKPAPPPTAPPTNAPTTNAPTTSGCDIPIVNDIFSQSAAADQQATASWTILRANQWTVYTPSSQWHLSASSAGGADVVSPDGASDASLGILYAQSPWTTSSVVSYVLSQTSGVQNVCMSPVEQAASGSGETQAVEITGSYRGVDIRAIIVASVLASNGSGTYTAESRTLFTPAAQWSPSAVRTLTLILKRAILVPTG